MADPIKDPSSQSRRMAPRPEDILFPDSLPSTDDAPTIISRSLPRVTDDPSSLRGRHLAHFELIESIGVGGMAAVLRARDTQLDRFVALKILPPDLAADPENIRRFHQEARSAAKLDHENVARVFFCGEDQRLHFIAFEFVEGDNLRTIVERRGRIPPGEALNYMIQVAAGLSHAAERGVVHRDIKPSNIIITPTGRAKLVDMGLARSLEPRTDKDLTQSGVTLGTFDYISPEQALEPRDADVRSDIYSLGCTFYHCLTGRPPVPEGTAARKLYHHQHVKPQDPRQLVPGLPDDVALILDRMMAKNPADRYQTVAELIQNSLQAARKLGAAPTAPEGVLAVEASLPTPPSARPLLIAAVFAAVVVVLLLLLDQQPGGATPILKPGKPTKIADHSTAPKTDKADSKKDDVPKVDVAREKDRGSGDVKEKDDVLTYEADKGEADLRQWLAKTDTRNARVQILFSNDFDFGITKDLDAAGIKIVARSVTLKAKSSTYKPTLRIRYVDRLTEDQVVWSALTIESEACEVQGLRFIVDADSEVPLAGLLLRGGSQRVVDCEFIQANPHPRDRTQVLASILTEAGTGSTQLMVRECKFLAYESLTEARASSSFSKQLDLKGGGLRKDGSSVGQDAVLRRGAVSVEMDDCAFGPHATALCLEGATTGRITTTLRHCSVFCGAESVVFEVRKGASAEIAASACLFSRPEVPEVETDPAILIHQEEDRDEVVYHGEGNRYHNLDGFWSFGDEVQDWQEYVDYLKQEGRGNHDSSPPPLTESPWNLDKPLSGLATASFTLSLDAPRKKREPEQTSFLAFQVNDKSAALRIGTGTPVRLIGVEKFGSHSYLAKLTPLETKPDPAAHKVRIVDPAVETGNGIYHSLEVAIKEAQPGDEIVIRHNGLLACKPIDLEESTIDLTIHPAPGYRPYLTFGETTDRDTALFTIQDARLKLIGLEFRLKPLREAFLVQAIVALTGDGGCTFRDCVVTLEQGDGSTHLAAATVTSPGSAKMKMDPPPGRVPGPNRVLFDNCVVRGDGDLLWDRMARPFKLQVKNTLVAVTGNFLNLEVPREFVPPPGQQVFVELTKVTTFLGGHLLRLNAGSDLKSLIPVRFAPTDCLFVSTATGKSLVHLDGPETDPQKLKMEKLLEWQPGTNAYGLLSSTYFDQQPPGDGMSVKPPMDADSWKTFTGEDHSNFNAKLTNTPATDLKLAKVTPEMMKGADAHFGAEPTPLLKLFNSTDGKE